ncbi:hypothetical protein [Halorubrum sp. GN11GM_10-3_MGM]|uniref:hypothetical protein n=1 Tax=Halorubrum sp. GN11GM_10-3_MGM TaxID=2518111 RepID=UPI0013053315|nr:hypothetical protein [Halorubrum sp. GN11GM_10-3_MGM]
MKPAIVRIRSSRGVDTEAVEASVLATDAALVDMAREQAGVSAAEFKSGKVVAE